MLQGFVQEGRCRGGSQRKPLHAQSRVYVASQLHAGPTMISLAGRDIPHSWGKFVFTDWAWAADRRHADHGRGVPWHGDDGPALLDNSGADLWVVQQGTLGVCRICPACPMTPGACCNGVTGAGFFELANVTYFTMQVPGRRQRPWRAQVARWTRCARHGGGYGAGALWAYWLAAPPGGRAPHHARALRGRGRRGHRLCLASVFHPAQTSTPVVGAGAAHGVLQWRSHGVHSAETDAQAQFQRQRRPVAQRAHRSPPCLQPPGALAWSRRW